MKWSAKAIIALIGQSLSFRRLVSWMAIVKLSHIKLRDIISCQLGYNRHNFLSIRL